MGAIFCAKVVACGRIARSHFMALDAWRTLELVQLVPLGDARQVCTTFSRFGLTSQGPHVRNLHRPPTKSRSGPDTKVTQCTGLGAVHSLGRYRRTLDQSEMGEDTGLLRGAYMDFQSATQVVLLTAVWHNLRELRKSDLGAQRWRHGRSRSRCWSSLWRQTAISGSNRSWSRRAFSSRTRTESRKGRQGWAADGCDLRRLPA